jgi:peptidoglycan/LPS O-acetylase OafA/YrhL
LAVLVFFCLGVPSITEGIAWHLTYTTNVWMFLRGDYYGPAGHLWSLAVEEQFYLVWPLLLLAWPRGWRLHGLVLGAIGLAIVVQISLWNVPLSPVLAPTCMFSLGLGALLALLSRQQSPHVGRLGRVALTLGLAMVAYGYAAKYSFAPVRTARLSRTPLLCFAYSLIAVWFIQKAAIRSFRGGLSARWSIRSSCLGKISYGIYLFHNFAGTYAQRLLLRSCRRRERRRSGASS